MRIAEVVRDTSETQIRVKIDLDGNVLPGIDFMKAAGGAP